MPEPPAAPRAVVLDTHVWLTLVNGGALSTAALRAIDAAAQRGTILIPAIVIWEVAMLEKRGRIALGQPCRQWVEGAFAAPGVALAPLTPDIAIESCSLPGQFNRDPADRMIVATARVHDAAILTRDRVILAYAKAGHVAAMAA